MTAYAGGVAGWASDAVPVYGPLAEHLLDMLDDPGRSIELAGRRALDAGAGSGVVGDLLRARGAEVISADAEPEMVAHLAGKGPAMLADVRKLPLRAGHVGVSVAAFVINHLPDPRPGLTELGRVTVADGWVLASVFGTDRAPAKIAVDEVAARFGFKPPGWYVDLQRAAATVGTVDGMADVAQRAGLRTVAVDELRVPLAALTPADLVRYRCALPHVRPFVAGLDGVARARFWSAAVAAVAATGVPFEPAVIRLAAQPTHRSAQSSRRATTSRRWSPRGPEAAISRLPRSAAVCRAAADPEAA